MEGGGGSKRTCDMSCLDDGTRLSWDSMAVDINMCSFVDVTPCM